jgi:hypothetical protein
MIEGIVLLGTTPLPGGRAWLGSDAHGQLPWGSPDDWDVAAGVLRTEIGDDGIFRFEGLEPDTYGVGIRTKDGATRHVWVELQPGQTSQRVRFVFGAASIRGRVFDQEGSPGVGWQVATYNWGQMPAAVQLIDDRTADANGAFEFTGLTGGNYVLAGSPVADLRDPRKRTAFVELAPGESKTVDLGTSSGALWTGRVVTPRGAPLALSDHLFLELDHSGALEQLTIPPELTIRSRVRPGSHAVLLNVWFAGRVPLGELAMPEHDLDRDLAVPRCMIQIRATYAGTKFTAEWVRSVLAASLSSESGTQLQASHGTQGQLYFFGVPPGEHMLTCRPFPIEGAPDGKLVVHIGPNDDEVELDVVVAER